MFALFWEMVIAISEAVWQLLNGHLTVYQNKFKDPMIVKRTVQKDVMLSENGP